MIGFRVDADESISIGHVMRCLSIASALKERESRFIFITSNEITKELISKSGYRAICLHKQSSSIMDELDEMNDIIQTLGINKLIIDSYSVTHLYLEKLMLITKVIYIDDINSFQYPVSMLINYNIYYEVFRYPDQYNSSTKLVLGCEYAPLRKEFLSVTPTFRQHVKKILITTGGTDNFNVAGRLLGNVLDDKLYSEIEFHVIVGSLNKNTTLLNKLAEGNKSIVLHRDTNKMSKLMEESDIAVTAGGFTMYELCACGVPAICFSFADNQIAGVKYFAKEDIMYYAGDIRDDEDMCISKISSYMRNYMINPSDRKQKGVRCRSIVDGKGVVRLADAIINL